MDLDTLLGGFDAPTNAMLGVVFVKGIIAQLFVVRDSYSFVASRVTQLV